MENSPSTERKHDNFDQFAQDYNAVHAKALDVSGADREHFSEYKVVEVARHENPEQPLRILDFGCGDGNSVKYMRTYFPSAELFGTDVSELSISEAEAKGITNTLFEPYDGDSLPFDDGSFDVVFTSMVFHHIEFSRHEQILKDIQRVLRPGGRFYIFEHNPINPITQKIVRDCDFDHDAVLLSHRYTGQLLERIGFSSLKTSFTLFLPRHWFFRWLLWTERLAWWIPVGAQYYIRAVK